MDKEKITHNIPVVRGRRMSTYLVANRKSRKPSVEIEAEEIVSNEIPIERVRRSPIVVDNSLNKYIDISQTYFDDRTISSNDFFCLMALNDDDIFTNKSIWCDIDHFIIKYQRRGNLRSQPILTVGFCLISLYFKLVDKLNPLIIGEQIFQLVVHGPHRPYPEKCNKLASFKREIMLDGRFGNLICENVFLPNIPGWPVHVIEAGEKPHFVEIHIASPMERYMCVVQPKEIRRKVLDPSIFPLSADYKGTDVLQILLQSLVYDAEMDQVQVKFENKSNLGFSTLGQSTSTNTKSRLVSKQEMITKNTAPIISTSLKVSPERQRLSFMSPNVKSGFELRKETAMELFMEVELHRQQSLEESVETGGKASSRRVIDRANSSRMDIAQDILGGDGECSDGLFRDTSIVVSSPPKQQPPRQPLIAAMTAPTAMNATPAASLAASFANPLSRQNRVAIVPRQGQALFTNRRQSFQVEEAEDEDFDDDDDSDENSVASNWDQYTIFGPPHVATKVMMLQLKSSLQSRTRRRAMNEIIVKMLKECVGLREHLNKCSDTDVYNLATCCFFTSNRGMGYVYAKKGETIDMCFVTLEGKMLICDDVIDISSASQRTHAPQNTSNNSGMHDGNSKKVSIILNRKHTQEINVVEEGMLIGLEALTGRKHWKQYVYSSGDIEACVIPLTAIQKYVGWKSSSTFDMMTYFWKQNKFWLVLKRFEDLCISCGIKEGQNIIHDINSAARIRTILPGDELFEQGSKRHFMYLILLGECSYVRKIGLNVMTHMPNSALITSREAHVRHRADNTVELDLGQILYKGGVSFMDGCDRFDDSKNEYRLKILLGHEGDGKEKDEEETAHSGRIDYFGEESRLVSSPWNSNVNLSGAVDPKRRYLARKMSAVYEEKFSEKQKSDPNSIRDFIPSFGTHANSLIASTFVEVCVIPLRTIYVCKILFEMLLKKSWSDLPLIAATDEEVLKRYRKDSKWIADKTQIVASCMEGRKNGDCYSTEMPPSNHADIPPSPSTSHALARPQSANSSSKSPRKQVHVYGHASRPSSASASATVSSRPNSASLPGRKQIFRTQF